MNTPTPEELETPKTVTVIDPAFGVEQEFTLPTPPSVATGLDINQWLEKNALEATDTQEQPDDLTAMKLGDQFDAALIGATITGQYAYSLTRLSMIVMQDMHVHPEVAQKMVAEQVVAVMREHGAESPVFVDDSLMFGADIAVEPETESQGPVAAIVTYEDGATGQIRGPIFTGEAEPPKADNVILIPGVTHGAVKGFADPNGIKS